MRRLAIIPILLYSTASILSVRARATATVQAQGIHQKRVPRTTDPIKRSLRLSDFPRTLQVTANVFTYEDLHSGDEKFTTTNLFVVTDEGGLVADGQHSPAATKGLVDAIAKVTRQPSRTFLNRVFPAMRSAYPHEWLKALDRADAMQAHIDIPGHGFTEPGPESREELVRPVCQHPRA